MSVADAVARLQTAEAELQRMGPAPFPVPITGLEAVVAGSITALTRSDWWVPGLRERVGAVLRDVPLDRLQDGFRGARPYNVAPPTPSPALRALHAVGLALADPERAVLVHLGTGSAADGDFYEALNLAALHRARVIFVVAVHPLDEGSPVPRQTAAEPAALAEALGLTAHRVDGSRAQDVHAAVVAAREAGGPHLIEARLVPGADLRARAGS